MKKWFIKSDNGLTKENFKNKKFGNFKIKGTNNNIIAE